MRYIIGGILVTAEFMLIRIWISKPQDREYVDLDWEQYRQRKEKEQREI